MAWCVSRECVACGVSVLRRVLSVGARGCVCVCVAGRMLYRADAHPRRVTSSAPGWRGTGAGTDRAGSAPHGTHLLMAVVYADARVVAVGVGTAAATRHARQAVATGAPPCPGGGREGRGGGRGGGGAAAAGRGRGGGVPLAGNMARGGAGGGAGGRAGGRREVQVEDVHGVLRGVVEAGDELPPLGQQPPPHLPSRGRRRAASWPDGTISRATSTLVSVRSEGLIRALGTPGLGGGGGRCWRGVAARGRAGRRGGGRAGTHRRAPPPHPAAVSAAAGTLPPAAGTVLYVGDTRLLGGGALRRGRGGAGARQQGQQQPGRQQPRQQDGPHHRRQHAAVGLRHVSAPHCPPSPPAMPPPGPARLPQARPSPRVVSSSFCSFLFVSNECLLDSLFTTLLTLSLTRKCLMLVYPVKAQPRAAQQPREHQQHTHIR